MVDTMVRIDRRVLEAFCSGVFRTLGLSDEDSRIAAEVLVVADAMGIPSHGVARIERYVEGLRTGLMVPHAEEETLTESPSSLVVDAHGGMGAPVAARSMRRLIEKAKSAGSAFGCVRDSNHFGIAGYYARMALAEDMIGIAATNTAALGVPTFGSAAMFGTNPFAFAAPAGEERAFVLDMSTTVVTRGKVEVYERSGKTLPEGWSVDGSGRSTHDAAGVLEGLQHRTGGGILPLGGLGTALGGHKGYGLAVMVDILCAVLSGAPSGPAVYDTPTSSARVSHFFGAIRISSFRDPVEFRRDMDAMLAELRATPPAQGEERVLYAGLPESERESESDRLGVPLSEPVFAKLVRIGKELGLPKL
ncbi:MAG: Ldh family oxidoreductase [Rectinemataceae bacterium]